MFDSKNSNSGKIFSGQIRNALTIANPAQIGNRYTN